MTTLTVPTKHSVALIVDDDPFFGLVTIRQYENDMIHTLIFDKAEARGVRDALIELLNE